MHRVSVFLNKKASSSKQKDWKKEIHQSLFRSDLTFYQSKSAQEFKASIKSCIEDKTNAIISVGGDGTFNHVLQEAYGTGIPTLVIPAGTANDLAREMGISQKLHRAMESIRRNNTKEIDMISVNKSYMATNGGIGLIGEVASAINRLRGHYPWFQDIMSSLKHETYALSLAKRLLLKQYKYSTVTLESEEFSKKVKTPMLLVNNQSSVAGTFCVAPQTRNNDGKFNVTVFTHPDPLSLGKAILNIKSKKNMSEDPHYHTFETKRLIVKSINRDKLTFYGDGEKLQSSQKLEFKIHPRVLTLFQPTHAPYQHHMRNDLNQEELRAI